MKKAALLATLWLVATFALLGPRIFERGTNGPITNPADFTAFYCGSRVLVERADPYLTEPLRTCEHEAAVDYGLQLVEGIVMPSPLPPFALLALAPMAILPFTVASPVWFALSLLAVVGAGALVRKLSGAPLWLVALTFALANGLQSMPSGQITPLIVLALCASAVALRAGRYREAALFALAMLAEPHLGVPACAALFLFAPPARRTLCLGILALAIVSAAWMGPGLVREYVGDVLPLHARSEVTQFDIQYSLTSLAYALGLSEPVALAAGGLSYGAMFLLGLWLARGLARAWNDEALLVLTPPALVLLGGVYIHLHLMVIALPLGLVLLERSRATSRMLAAAAVFCLAVPWTMFSHMASSPKPRHVPPAPGGVLAETAEIAFVLGGGYGDDPRSVAEQIAVRLPTWLGLVALTGAAGLSLRRPRKQEQPRERSAFLSKAAR